MFGIVLSTAGLLGAVVWVVPPWIGRIRAYGATWFLSITAVLGSLLLGAAAAIFSEERISPNGSPDVDPAMGATSVGTIVIVVGAISALLVASDRAKNGEVPRKARRRPLVTILAVCYILLAAYAEWEYVLYLIQTL